MINYARQAIVQVIFSAITKALLFVTFIVLYKAFEKAAMGAFAIAYSITAILAIISEAGLRGLLLREIPRNESEPTICRNLVAQAQFARLVIAPIYIAVVFLAGLALLPKEQYLLLLCLAFSAWLESNSNLQRGILRSFHHFTVDGLLSSSFRALLLLSIGILVWNKSLSPVNAALAFMLCALAETVVTHTVTVRLAGISSWAISPARKDWIGLVKKALPFTILSVVGLLYLRTGLFFLGLPKTELSLQQAAGFNLAARIPEGVMFLPLALMNVAIPFFSRHFGRPELIKEKLFHYERLFGVASILVSVGMFVLCIPIILVLASNDYIVFTTVFKIYALTIPLTFLQYLYSNILIASQMEKIVAKRYFVVLVINLMLNVILVQRFGAIGAVTALLISELVGLGIDLVYMLKLNYYPALSSLSIWCGSIIFSTVAAYTVRILPHPISLIIYGIFCTMAGLATFLLSNGWFVRKAKELIPVE